MLIDMHPTKNIAIYHGFPLFHYEMLGYLLEYCCEHGRDFTLYTETNNIHGWLHFYINRFKGLQKYIKPPRVFDADKHDVVFLVTDDDPTLSIGYKQYMKDKLICINHYFCNRVPNVTYYIGVRHFIKNPTCPWAFPCWDIVNTKQKHARIIAQEKVHVAMIGSSCIPISYDYIKGFFSNADDIIFHVINRDIPIRIDRENIYYYENVTVEDMMTVLFGCHFIFCDPIQGDVKETDIMTASAPLAFGMRCCLLMSARWMQCYCLTSPIEIQDLQSIVLTKQMFFDRLQQVDDEFFSLKIARDTLFDKVISTIRNQHK